MNKLSLNESFFLRSYKATSISLRVAFSKSITSLKLYFEFNIDEILLASLIAVFNLGKYS